MAEFNLTPAQRAAVEHRRGPILVSAAAGSGKTRVLVERLMHRLRSPEEDCNIDNFLIITFTKKAASELRSRIARKLTDALAEDPENVHLQQQQNRLYLAQISTIHAFCANLIREFSYTLDVPADFRMIEETESEIMRRQLADGLLLDRYELIEEDPELKILVDGLGAGRDDRKIPDLLLDVYRTAQCHLFPGQWLHLCRSRLDVDSKTGAEETDWGRFLLERFRTELEQQIGQLEQINDLVLHTEALTSYQGVISSTLASLRSLTACTTWDETYAALHESLSFDRMPPVKNCPAPELQERVKAIRKDAVELVRSWAEEFYGPSEQVLADLRQNAASMGGLFSLAEEFTGRYDAEKRRQHLLDFNDLEHLALRLLLEEDGMTPTPLAAEVSRRFREIMVDEYQDTNQVQDSIIRAISDQEKNLFLVGDVKQSIYRFRLADPGIFLEKYRSYPEWTPAGEGAQRILLSRNFRSEEAVLDAANEVFRCCMSRGVGDLDYTESEELRFEPKLPPLPQPLVEFHCISTRQTDPEAETPEKEAVEAAFVARRIQMLLEEPALIRDGTDLRPVEPKDIVILLRAPSNSASFFLEELKRREIPSASDNGDSILDTREVETLLNLLQVIDNAHQDIPLAGVLLSPLFALPADVLAAARGAQKEQDLYDCLCAYAPKEPKIAAFLRTLEELRDLCVEKPLHQLLNAIQSRTRIEDVFGVMPNGTLRRENLHSFFALAAEYAEDGRKSLHQFLDYVSVLREEGSVPVSSTKGNAVTVMSIHKSKGLEFPVVFLCGLSKRFNMDDLSGQVLFHKELGVGCNVYDDALHTRYSSLAKTAISRATRSENLSEELRVLYVAMTRPQCMLLMTYCSEGLEKKLKDLAARLSPAASRLLASKAGCLGDWVLQTALLRSEAGELHAFGGKPEGTRVSRLPWVIRLHQGTRPEHLQTGTVSEQEAPAPAQHPQELGRLLRFSYEHSAAVSIPSKTTATQLKGRRLDEEANDGVPRPDGMSAGWRQPSLLQQESALTPAQRGTAMHLAMQYLDFSRTSSVEEIQDQLERMRHEEYLTAQQVESVSAKRLYAAFCGELGDLLRKAERVIREFKFSILVDAEQWYPGAGKEKMLLQGVTDCCLVIDGELTVIDFKTDRIRPGGEREAAERYRPQLEAYSVALHRIFELPVARKLLYFFATDTLFELK